MASPQDLPVWVAQGAAQLNFFTSESPEGSLFSGGKVTADTICFSAGDTLPQQFQPRCFPAGAVGLAHFGCCRSDALSSRFGRHLPSLWASAAPQSQKHLFRFSLRCKKSLGESSEQGCGLQTLHSFELGLSCSSSGVTFISTGNPIWGGEAPTLY